MYDYSHCTAPAGIRQAFPAPTSADARYRTNDDGLVAVIHFYFQWDRDDGLARVIELDMEPSWDMTPFEIMAPDTLEVVRRLVQSEYAARVGAMQ